MKKLCCLLTVFVVLLALCVSAYAEEVAPIYPPAYSVFERWPEETAVDAVTLSGDLKLKAGLLMEAETGTVLYSNAETEHLPIASVTKIMSTLLVAEAIDSGKISLADTVTVSNYAASMGGSQVYLEPGEQMSVDELLKCLIVVSANDAAVALAEHIYGSAESFIEAMNSRAAELGMTNTHFVNTTGLDDGGYSCALDVAVMTRELLKHELIFDYTTIWMDSVRGGAFGLSNTNKLVRFYKGANGMKTGFTTEAMYCVSATAERDGMQLISVVLGSPTSDDRFAAAKKMLDFGFANFALKTLEPVELAPVPVGGGIKEQVAVSYECPVLLCEKGKGEPAVKFTLPEKVTAPVSAGDRLGEAVFTCGDTELARVAIVASESADKISFLSYWGLIWKNMLGI